MDKVSIIVPVYNGEKYIGKCLESLIGQSYTNIEILVIDDGSIDKTKSICDKYALADDRIVYIYQNNSGVSSARNLGLMKASGKYICFVDSDDYVKDNYVSHLVSIMSEDIALAVAGHITVDEEGNEIESSPKIYFGSIGKDEAIKLAISMRGFQGYPFSKLFRKSILDEYNLTFDSGISNLEDLLFIVNYLMATDKKTGVNMEPVYHYVKQSGSVRVRCKTSKTFDERWLSEMDALDEIVDLLKGNKNITMAKARRALSAVFYLKRMNRCGYEDIRLMKRYQRYIRRDLLKACLVGEGDTKWILSGMPYAVSLSLGKLIIRK